MRRLSAAPPEHRFHTGQQLHNTEGLCDIVVCAVFQTGHLVDLCGLGREHDDRQHRRILLRLKPLQNRIAVQIGQHDVQQHQRGQLLLQPVKKIPAVRKSLHSVPAGLQRTGNQLPYPIVILYAINQRHDSFSFSPDFFSRRICRRMASTATAMALVISSAACALSRTTCSRS